MMKISFRQGLYAFLSLFCMLLIFTMSAQAADRSQLLSEGVLDHVLRLFGLSALPSAHWLQIGIRKLAHFTEFFLLGSSTALFFRQRAREAGKKGRSWMIQTLLLCLLFAVSDEWHQYYVPGRSMQISDMILDTIGAAAAAVVLRIKDDFTQVCKERGNRIDE